jgi:fibronectin type 3 domain-containing protein
MSIKHFYLCLFFIAAVVWPHCYGDPPKWRADARCFLDGPSGAFDDIAVKDPSIVYSGGQWHLFYTGRDSSSWRMGYVSADSISQLNSATRYFMSSLNGGTYFCAPQVFWFEAKGKWYLIYQSGLGATFSANTDISNPSGWNAGIAMGINDSGALDFWCISDGANVYCFYSPMDGTHTIKRRSTTVANFPYGWSSATVVATDTFEAPHVYKNKADGKYYMMVEDITRHFELWTADNPGGTWTKLEEYWAAGNQLIFNADHWTDQVSHGEILRAGKNEKLEISDIGRCEILIQGVTDENYIPGGDYAASLYDLGLIRRCPAGPADLDNDCDIDFEDFGILALQWQQSPGVPSADLMPLGGDGIVDLNDLGLFVDNWLWPILTPDYVPPGMPTGLVATTGSLQVSLDWDDSNDISVQGYNVYRSETSGSGYSKLNGSLVTSSDYVDSTVTLYTTYYYVVIAVDMSFNESEFSNEDSATPYDATPPAPPTSLVASAGDGTVSLDWLDNSEDDLDGYNIYRSTTSGGGYSKLNGLLLSETFYDDNSVTNETTYYYVVTAVDIYTNESGYSTEVSATPTGNPPTIYNFEGITQSDTEYNAFACDVDTFPFDGSSDNVNLKTEATDQQYIDISANDTNEWSTADAGFLDEIFLWVEMKINEAPEDVNQIDLTFNGNTSGSAAVTHSIYVLKAGTDWTQNSSWVQVGSDMSIEPSVDTMMSRTISSDFGTYIDGATGQIIWAVYETTSSEVMNINYLEMVVTAAGDI